MKRFFAVLVTFVVLIGVFSMYASFFGDPFSKYLMEKKTKQFLINNGYGSENILSISSDYQSKRNSDNMKGVVAHVVFKDEPNIQYLYIQWKQSGQIQQHCTYYDLEKKTEQWQSTGTLKYMDSNCTERDG